MRHMMLPFSSTSTNTALNFIYDKLTYIINLMFSSSNNHQHHFKSANLIPCSYGELPVVFPLKPGLASKFCAV